MEVLLMSVCYASEAIVDMITISSEIPPIFFSIRGIILLKVFSYKIDAYIIYILSVYYVEFKGEMSGLPLKQIVWCFSRFEGRRMWCTLGGGFCKRKNLSFLRLNQNLKILGYSVYNPFVNWGAFEWQQKHMFLNILLVSISRFILCKYLEVYNLTVSYYEVQVSALLQWQTSQYFTWIVGLLHISSMI